MPTQPLTFEDLELPERTIEPSVTKRTRKPKATISKAALRKSLETINAALTVTGQEYLKLEDIELDSLAEAWSDVIKMYPQVGELMSKGNKLTVWGNAIFVTYLVAERRYVLYTKVASRTTHNNNGDDRNGENNASGTFDSISKIFNSGRQ